MVYIPISATSGQKNMGIIRLSSSLTERALNHFRTISRLEATLFIENQPLVTTFHMSDHQKLAEAGSDGTVFRVVLGAGRPLYTWSDLPSGRVRSYFFPLTGFNGERMGMVAISTPIQAIAGQFNAFTAIIPNTLLILAVGTVFAYIWSSRVREPIMELIEAATRLSQGDLTSSIPTVNQVELGPLAEQLENARHNLQVKLETIAGAEARQRALFAAMHEPIITTSVDGAITDFNEAAAALFGHSELFNRPLQDILPFISPANELAGGQDSWQGYIVDASGSTLDVEVRRTALVGGSLSISHLYTIHDVSRYAGLARLREQLLENAAHELRGPLTALENSLEILSVEYGELSTDDFDRLMSSSRRTAHRLRSLLEELLSAGSIQSGRFLVRPGPVELTVVVDDTCEAVEGMLTARHQSLERELPSGPLLLVVDRMYLRQAITNLLSNASRHSPEGEVIRLVAAETGGTLKITVEDRGPGIPLDRQGGLFSRFYLASRESEPRGIGLGLAIAKAIVEAHGGQIGVDSRVGVGTRVWITLPLAEGRGHADSGHR
jgi:two-component system sensor histidine kinase VicK